MCARLYLALLIVLLVVAFCVGCAGTSRELRKVGKVFSPVTSVVKGTAGRLVSGAKGAGSAAAGDVRQYSTSLPGTTRTTLTPSQRRAIANYEMKKRYQEQVRKYNIDSRLIPKNAKVHVNY